MASLCGRLTKQISEISSESDNESELGEAHKFSFRSLEAATNNFSNHNLIERGSFGEIYRGVLSNGTLIAVHRFRFSHSFNFASPRTVEIFSCIRHPNIDRVIGYCFDEDHFLVFKYVSNCTLRDLLDDKEKREFVFNWPMRVAICNGIARGLHHLHEETNPCIIHRDINSSNVFVDSNFTPKITGFDLVKFVYESPPEEEEYDELMGTMGYIDPEYFQTRKCTPKSDVYGFGVVMLQIICGRTAISFDIGDEAYVCLVQWVLDLSAENRALEVVDPVLADFPVDQVLAFIDVALSCVKEESRLRPSMGEVIQMLNRVCDSPLTSFELQQPDTPYVSAASSFRSSLDSPSFVWGESSVEFTGTEQQDTGITVSSSGNPVLRQSKTTMVFERPSAVQGEYAAYWRKKNMMPRNKA